MVQKLIIVFVHITTRYIIIVSLVCWRKFQILCTAQVRMTVSLIAVTPLVPVIISVSIDPQFMVTYTKSAAATEKELKLYVTPCQVTFRFIIHCFSCFIGEPGVLFGAFLVPILAILLFNSIVFVLVIRVLMIHSKKKFGTRDKGTVETVKRLLISSFGIMFLFGLSWVFGAFTISAASEVFQYLFTIFTSLQGFFIFFFFCVLGKEARELWLQLLCRGRKIPWITISLSRDKTPVSTSGLSSGETRNTRATSTASSPRHSTLSSIYLQRPTESYLRRMSDSQESESAGSIEMNTRDSTIANLHAIAEEEEEEDIAAEPVPEQSSTEKTRRNSNTESMHDLSLNGSKKKSITSPLQQDSPNSPASPPQQLAASSAPEDTLEVLENSHANVDSD